MKVIKNLLFAVIVLLLVIPLIQARYHLIPEAGLSGAVNLKAKPYAREITWEKWMKDDFHDDFQLRVEDYSPFHNTFYRIGCQLDYSLFRTTHAIGFISGKNGCIFDKAYIHEFNGDYFIGQKSINRKLTRLKALYDSLKSDNVSLVLVFGPVKSSFYRQNIPDEFNPGQKNISNYLYSLQKLNELGLPFLDLDSYFRSIKDTCRYELFPEYGNSWNVYAQERAIDTLVAYLRKNTHKDLPNITWEARSKNIHSKQQDNDNAQLLNLIFPVSQTQETPPVINIENNSAKKRLSVLVISDNTYQDFLNELSSDFFAHYESWLPFSKSNPVPFDKKTLAEKLKKFDVILFLTSELNLHNGYGDFPDDAYLAFHPKIQESRVYRLGNEIRNNPDWFSLMIDKAKQQNHTFEEMAQIDAEYMFFTGFSDLKDKTRFDSIEYTTLQIKQDPAWLAKVVQKAKDQHVSVDTALYRDAVFTYNHLLHKNEQK